MGRDFLLFLFIWDKIFDKWFDFDFIGVESGMWFFDL